LGTKAGQEDVGGAGTRVRCEARQLIFKRFQWRGRVRGWTALDARGILRRPRAEADAPRAPAMRQPAAGALPGERRSAGEWRQAWRREEVAGAPEQEPAGVPPDTARWWGSGGGAALRPKLAMRTASCGRCTRTPPGGCGCPPDRSPKPASPDRQRRNAPPSWSLSRPARALPQVGPPPHVRTLLAPRQLPPPPPPLPPPQLPPLPPPSRLPLLRLLPPPLVPPWRP